MAIGILREIALGILLVRRQTLVPRKTSSENHLEFIENGPQDIWHADTEVAPKLTKRASTKTELAPKRARVAPQLYKYLSKCVNVNVNVQAHYHI